MQSIPIVADRATLEGATELIARFGVAAEGEAAARADRSRDLGNVVNFCRWRQIERLIGMLATRQPFGTVH